MKRLGQIWIVVAAISILVVSETAQAWGWLTLYPTEIEAVLWFDGNYRRQKDGDGTLDNQWEGGVSIRQRGYIIDPEVTNFDLGVEPVYVWGLFDISDDPQKLTGNNLSYYLRLEMLRGTPGPFKYNISAMRVNNVNSGSLGGRYDTEVENKSAAVTWKSTAFPMSLTFDDRLYKQNFLSGKSGATSRRDEHVKSLTLQGRSSKTGLFAEHLSMDNLVPGRNLDYELDRINLGHTLPWGRNSKLNSRFGYYDRSGFNANKRINLNERATIQHTENIFSVTSYDFSSIIQTYKTILNSGGIVLTHQLYGNLVTAADIWGMSQTSDPQDVTRLRGGISSQYSKVMFGAGVTAGLGYSYQVTDRDSRLGLVDVSDESQVVPLNGAVVLNRRFILTATIIVTNADGALVYTEGIDYTTFDLPDDLTQLQVIPGGQIETGDTILVSYQALALPSQEYSTTNTRYNLGLNLGWVSFSHSYNDLNEKLISGQGDSFLNPRLDVRTNLAFNWNISNVEFQVGGDRRYYKRKEFESTTYSFRQSVDWGAFGNTLWNLNAVQSFTETTTLKTDLYSLDLSVDWQPRSNLSIRPRVGIWKRFDEGESIGSDERNDMFITAGFALRWWYRKVTFQMAYNHNQRTIDTNQLSNGESKTVEDRLTFNLTRRFY